MKKQTILILLLGLLLPCVIYGSLNSFSSMEKDKTDIIELKGDLNQPKEIRVANFGSTIITAERQGNIIVVLFKESLGNIQITITNEMGEEVYFQKVNTTAQPQVTIPLLTLPRGSYTIIFSNDRGGMMYGDFMM